MPSKVTGCFLVGPYQFEGFQLDVARYELRRNGHVLKLEKIPMELLILLINKQGELVCREDIIEKIWGRHVFIETEHGINTAVRKIRQTLGDDPEHPRFVQTVVGKGYRFVAAVSSGGSDAWPPNGSKPKYGHDEAIPDGGISRSDSSNGHAGVAASISSDSGKGSLKGVVLRWRWPICGFALVLTLTTLFVGLGFHGARRQFVKVLNANRPTG